MRTSMSEAQPEHTKWLGSVPEGWEVTPLKFVATVFPSNVDKHSRENEAPVALCNYTDVYYNDIISAEIDFMKATATNEQIEKFRLRAGDTIVTKDSESADDIGISAYVSEDLDEVVCGYHLSMIRPGNRVVGRFIKRLFDSHYVKAVLETSANGLTRVGLGQYALDNIYIPLPPAPLQNVIADFLDRETVKIDALIDKQEQLIATLREDRDATIHDTVTTNRVDPSRQTLPLKRISRILDCKHITAEFTSDGIPLASIREVQGRYVNLHTAKRTTEHFFRLLTSGDRLPRQGDLIFSRNATVGQVAEVQAMNEPFAMGQDVCLIRPDRSLVRSGFLWYSLRSDSVLRQLELMMIGSTFKRINVEEVKNIFIDVPSLEEQDLALEFLDERISKIDDLIAKSTEMIEVLREYRSALITNAVTGKIDVREAV